MLTATGFPFEDDFLLIQPGQLNLRASQCYSLAWDKLLTDEERTRLGGTVEQCWQSHRDLVRLWMEMKGLSQFSAIVELGYGLGFLFPPDYEWLMREIGEERPASEQAPRPSWDSARRELRFRGRVIRRIRAANVASTISSILESFQEAGWPPRIAHAVDVSLSPQPLHDAVRSLNRNLEEIRFAVDGDHIFWTVR